MSSQVITRALGGNAPQTYLLGASEELEPTAILAHFDGSGASGTFRPCVSYYTQDGKLFARAFPTDTVAAGASANVAYFPGLSQSSRPSGIFYDTPNSGDYLDIAATGTDSSGYGVKITTGTVDVDGSLEVDGGLAVITAGENVEVDCDQWLLLHGNFAELVANVTPSWQTTTHVFGVLRLGDQANAVQVGDDISGAGGATLTVHTSAVTLGNLVNTVHLVEGTSWRVRTTSIGFYGAAAITKPTVTGSRGGNAALASLLTALANLGLVTDSST